MRLELEARLLAEGRTSRLQSHISRQHPESREPTMPDPATVDVVLEIKRNTRMTLVERYRAARALVDAERFGPPDRGPETEEQFAFRVVTQYVGVATAEVARRESCYPLKVQRIRRAAGQDSRGMPARGAS